MGKEWRRRLQAAWCCVELEPTGRCAVRQWLHVCVVGLPLEDRLTVAAVLPQRCHVVGPCVPVSSKRGVTWWRV